MTTQAPERLFGYDVLDTDGSKIGSVDGVWIDDATDELEFIGVKTGMLLGKTHLIPTADAQIIEGSIQVPYTKDQVNGAPSVGTDDELTPDQEDEVYGYYGLDRSTASSPSGLPSGGGTADYETSDTGGVVTGTVPDTDLEDDQRVRLHEEELQVGKRQVETGRVRVRKVVRTEQREVPVELRREDVVVERVPASEGEVAGDAFEEGEIEVPVTREEPVIGKEARATGEVRLGKNVETETRTVGDQIRREDVEVDKDTDADVTDTRY